MNNLFGSALDKVTDETRNKVKCYTDQVDAIAAFLQDNTGSDSIDVSCGTKIRVDIALQILDRIAERKQIPGIRFGYYLKDA